MQQRAGELSNFGTFLGTTQLCLESKLGERRRLHRFCVFQQTENDLIVPRGISKNSDVLGEIDSIDAKMRSDTRQRHLHLLTF